jgi:hypothetical protein
LHSIEEKCFCPVEHINILIEGAQQRGVDDTLWCSDAGVPYTQPAAISRLLKVLLAEAGIDPSYSAYSMRHALITALFDGGMSEVEVNAYTGHSNKSHTAATNYLHVNKNRIGHALANRVANVQTSQTAIGEIRWDNIDSLREESAVFDGVDHQEPSREPSGPRPVPNFSSFLLSSSHSVYAATPLRETVRGKKR